MAKAEGELGATAAGVGAEKSNGFETVLASGVQPGPENSEDWRRVSADLGAKLVRGSGLGLAYGSKTYPARCVLFLSITRGRAGCGLPVRYDPLHAVDRLGSRRGRS